MRKGGWKRKLAWVFGAIIVIAIILAITFRAWLPSAAKLALATRGINSSRIIWEGKDSIKIEDLSIKKPGREISAASIIAFTPWAWKRFLKAGSNDLVYVTVNGWKIVSTGGAGTNTRIGPTIAKLQNQLDRLRTNCPQAVFLNGVFDSGGKEFRFGAIQWKDGVLNGDFTWPQLNDPADFKLTRTNLIVRQIALEIGSRINFADMRAFGNARWKTNRVDFDLTFGAENNFPRHGFIRTKGLDLQGKWIGLPQIEYLKAGGSITFTNGAFTLVVTEIDSETSPTP